MSNWGNFYLRAPERHRFFRCNPLKRKPYNVGALLAWPEILVFQLLRMTMVKLSHKSGGHGGT